MQVKDKKKITYLAIRLNPEERSKLEALMKEAGVEWKSTWIKQQLGIKAG